MARLEEWKCSFAHSSSPELYLVVGEAVGAEEEGERGGGVWPIGELMSHAGTTFARVGHAKRTRDRLGETKPLATGAHPSTPPLLARPLARRFACANDDNKETTCRQSSRLRLRQS